MRCECEPIIWDRNMGKKGHVSPKQTNIKLTSEVTRDFLPQVVVMNISSSILDMATYKDLAANWKYTPALVLNSDGNTVTYVARNFTVYWRLGN